MNDDNSANVDSKSLSDLLGELLDEEGEKTLLKLLAEEKLDNEEILEKILGIARGDQ